jgi:hypothetical protein
MLWPLTYPIRINLLYTSIDPFIKQNSVETCESQGSLIRKVKPYWMRRISDIGLEESEVMLGYGIRRQRQNV